MIETELRAETSSVRTIGLAAGLSLVAYACWMIWASSDAKEFGASIGLPSIFLIPALSLAGAIKIYGVFCHIRKKQFYWGTYFLITGAFMFGIFKVLGFD